MTRPKAAKGAAAAPPAETSDADSVSEHAALSGASSFEYRAARGDEELDDDAAFDVDDDDLFEDLALAKMRPKRARRGDDDAGEENAAGVYDDGDDDDDDDDGDDGDGPRYRDLSDVFDDDNDGGGA